MWFDGKKKGEKEEDITTQKSNTSEEGNHQQITNSLGQGGWLLVGSF